MGNAELWLGVLGGLLTSSVLWAWVHWFSTPTLLWSPKISVRPRPPGVPGPPDYRVKIKNSGRVRRLVDLRVQAYLAIDSLDEADEKTTLLVRLETSTEAIAQLYPQQNRVVSLELSELTPFAARRLRDVGLGAITEDPNRSLDDFFELSPGEVKLRFVALVVDALTGILHVRESHLYTQDDQVPHPFSADTEPFDQLTRHWAQRSRLAVNRWRSRKSVNDSGLAINPSGWQRE